MAHLERWAKQMAKPYFLIHSVKIEGGVATVDGRLGDGVLKTGHLVSRSFLTSEAWEKKEYGPPCALVVQSIEAYQRRLDEISAGLTARLSLSGSLLSVLKSAAVIE